MRVYRNPDNLEQSYDDYTTFWKTIDASNENADGSTEITAIGSQIKSLKWMPLYKFDNTPGAQGEKVYDILMDY